VREFEFQSRRGCVQNHKQRERDRERQREKAKSGERQRERERCSAIPRTSHTAHPFATRHTKYTHTHLPPAGRPPRLRPAYAHTHAHTHTHVHTHAHMYTDTQIYTHTYKQARIILHDIIEGVEKGKHTISFARFHCCSRALRARARAVPFNSEKGNRSYAKTAPFLCTCRDSCMCVRVCVRVREKERERERESVCVRACKVVYVCEDVLFAGISNTRNMLQHNLRMFVDART